MNKLSRRDFLKLAGITSAGLALSGCGVQPTELPTATLTFMPTPSLTATPIPTKTSTPTPKPPETLRDFSSVLGIKFGTVIEGTARFWENKSWQRVAQQEFNLGVITPLWHVLIPRKDTFDFSFPDLQLEYAQLAGMETISGQTLVYSYFLPDWLKTGAFSRDQLISMIQDYIQQIMKHYKGKVTRWNVVNEAGFNVPGWDYFEKHIGQEYVEIAFESARQADPTAILYYNDFGNETEGGSEYNKTKRIVANLKTKGLIDAVGIQLHVYALSSPQRTGEFGIKSGATRYHAIPSELVEGMKGFDVPVYITELDVDLRDISSSNEERFIIQANIYSDIVEAAFKSGVCKDITVWGFGDKYSWLEQLEFNGSKDSDATIFDDDFKPKPAYYAILESLQKHVP